LNTPNRLTVSRIGLTLLFLALYSQDGLTAKIWGLIIFVIASLTDFLDGYIARKYELISKFGKIMDPIADKFLVLSALFIFMQMNMLAVWMFMCITAREIFVTGLRLMAMQKGVALAAERAGKLKTVLQIVLVYLIIIYTILVEPDAGAPLNQSIMSAFLTGINIFIWAVVIITLWSGLSFIWNNRKELFHVG